MPIPVRHDIPAVLQILVIFHTLFSHRLIAGQMFTLTLQNGCLGDQTKQPLRLALKKQDAAA